MRKTILIITLLAGFLTAPAIWTSTLSAAEPGKKKVLYPTHIEEKPKIDGILDEEIWQTQPLDEDFISYAPHMGEKLPYKTHVWTAYDSKNLYFAFMCFDPEPQKIKTSLARRDTIRYDDTVGLSLDNLGTQEHAWALFVNPNGIQMDMQDSAIGSTDRDPDLVFDSAGKITDKGYQVEVCIPLRSINYKSGKDIKMGILFWRFIPRHGIRASWPEVVPGGGVFHTHTSIVYKKLKRTVKLELLPNYVYGSSRERETPENWGDKDTFKGFGIGIKYGLTSSLTADIAINPDFSQVESDSYQVEVNRRYPIFFSEKRPYFMESVGIFEFFTVPTGYYYGGFLPYPVNTRRIVDPAWSAKVTGTIGKATIGILTAGDEHPGLTWSWGVNPNEGKSAFWGIARGRYNLGKDNYIGFLYSGRNFAGDYNRVYGADVLYRPWKTSRFNASFLYSTFSTDDSNDDGNSGNYNLTYTYRTKTLSLQTSFEHIGTDFRMDSSFMARTGVNNVMGMAGYYFTPKFKKFNWLKLIVPTLWVNYLHDLNTKMDDYTVALMVNTYFSKGAYAGFRFTDMRESWQGKAFHLDHMIVFGQVQLTKWLRLHLEYTWGDSVYYEGDPAYIGKGVVIAGYLDFAPSEKFRLHLNYDHSGLKKDGQQIYSHTTYNSLLTYQINKYLTLRNILRYCTCHERLLTDFLVSFSLIPGTVVHAGYGALYENREWQPGVGGNAGTWASMRGTMHHVKRSFFLKLSYRWRL